MRMRVQMRHVPTLHQRIVHLAIEQHIELVLVLHLRVEGPRVPPKPAEGLLRDGSVDAPNP